MTCREMAGTRHGGLAGTRHGGRPSVTTLRRAKRWNDVAGLKWWLGPKPDGRLFIAHTGKTGQPEHMCIAQRVHNTHACIPTLRVGP
eukprot:129408-Chlamydomonas_euryale.AAC.5